MPCWCGDWTVVLYSTLIQTCRVQNRRAGAPYLDPTFGCYLPQSSHFSLRTHTQLIPRARSKTTFTRGRTWELIKTGRGGPAVGHEWTNLDIRRSGKTPHLPTAWINLLGDGTDQFQTHVWSAKHKSRAPAYPPEDRVGRMKLHQPVYLVREE